MSSNNNNGHNNSNNSNGNGHHKNISMPIITSFIPQSSLQPLLQLSSKKNLRAIFKNPKFLIFTIFVMGFLFMLEIWLSFDPKVQIPKTPCLVSQGNASSSLSSPPSTSPGVVKFWEQPDGMGYRSCLGRVTRSYKKESQQVVRERRKYLMVRVNGGLNQQRNQVVDSVVVARILGATLVVPLLEINPIWGDESEFSDIFDLDHFKRTLANDVNVVSTLPASYVQSRLVVKSPSLRMSPAVFRQRYLSLFERNPVLLLRGFDSSLSTELPRDLQKLRCKAAFHALRFAPRIMELGNKLTERMRSGGGPYLALHLRLERDVWIRTGCLSGLSREFDEKIKEERKAHPDMLTSRSKMTYRERKLAGLCPLTALELARVLKALGAPSNARIYWAGGDPLGGKQALEPLTREFPHLYNKEDLAYPNELKPFAKKASILAAIDYIVCQNSDVFMASHGGNMGHALQGQRAYEGHRKTITPNKRQMISYLMNDSLPEDEFNKIIWDLHKHSLGQPVLRVRGSGRPVTKYPVPECMCNETRTKHHTLI